MAKISARGATAIARYKKGEATIVVCSDGRILVKYLKGDGYKVLAKVKAGADIAGVGGRLAAKLGYV
jgi:hypothetical protein